MDMMMNFLVILFVLCRDVPWRVSTGALFFVETQCIASLQGYHTDSQSSASLTDLSRWNSNSFAYLRKLLWATARERT